MKFNLHLLKILRNFCINYTKIFMKPCNFKEKDLKRIINLLFHVIYEMNGNTCVHK